MSTEMELLLEGTPSNGCNFQLHHAVHEAGFLYEDTMHQLPSAFTMGLFHRRTCSWFTSNYADCSLITGAISRKYQLPKVSSSLGVVLKKNRKMRLIIDP